MRMTVDRMRALPKADQAELLDWLHEHDLRFVRDFEVHGDTLIADTFKANEHGSRYAVHEDGSTHTRDDGCSGIVAAREYRAVKIRRQLPVRI
jgi:hypothetical protein